MLRVIRRECRKGHVAARRVGSVAASAMLVAVLTAGAVQGADGVDPAVDATGSASASPAAATAAWMGVVNIPPGHPLPSDSTCANRVRPTPEDRPSNAAYNQRTGSRPLPDHFFDAGSHDPRTREITARVTGNFTGTTGELLAWAACKWGIDPRVVVAQATAESSRQSSYQGDWTRDSRYCAPGHPVGADGRAGWCPQSWGIMQVKYRYFSGAFPEAMTSTAYNLDTAFAVWRACFEGYERWLADTTLPGKFYVKGDMWGCIGRWYSGEWRTPVALGYIKCVQVILVGREHCT